MIHLYDDSSKLHSRQVSTAKKEGVYLSMRAGTGCPCDALDGFRIYLYWQDLSGLRMCPSDITTMHVPGRELVRKRSVL